MSVFIFRFIVVDSIHCCYLFQFINELSSLLFSTIQFISNKASIQIYILSLHWIQHTVKKPELTSYEVMIMIFYCILYAHNQKTFTTETLNIMSVCAMSVFLTFYVSWIGGIILCMWINYRTTRWKPNFFQQI